MTGFSDVVAFRSDRYGSVQKRHTTLGTGTLNSGTATYSTSALAVGSHSITGTYADTSSYATSSAVAATVASTGASPAMYTGALNTDQFESIARHPKWFNLP